MTNLPKLPNLKSGIKYPEMQVEEQFDAVKKTNPNEYILAIKTLLKDIKIYQECLEFQGYKLEKLETLDPDVIYAKKEIIIR